MYDPWTQHLYSYCGNNPTSMVDPTGHSFLSFFLKLFKSQIKKVLDTLVKSPNKTVFTAKDGTPAEQERANSYTKGNNDPGFNKEDTYKNQSSKFQLAPLGGLAKTAIGYVGGSLLGTDDARDAYLHYLNGKGVARNFNLKKAAYEDENISKSVLSEVTAQQIAASKIGAKETDGVFIVSSKQWVGGTANSPDWFLAIGRYQTGGAAIVMKKGNEYAMLSQVTIYDRYNFEGYLAPIGQMAERGEACNYDHYGHGYLYRTWTTGG